MIDQISFLQMLDDAEHPTWLLSGKPGMQNENGVYTENVMEFREGKLSGVYVKVELCAEGKFILYEFSYMTGTYGCGHPLCRPCHECHRANSAEFLAEMVFSTFKNGVVPYDKNLTNYPKETKELLKLCKKACERIAKEFHAAYLRLTGYTEQEYREKLKQESPTVYAARVKAGIYQEA